MLLTALCDCSSIIAVFEVGKINRCTVSYNFFVVALVQLFTYEELVARQSQKCGLHSICRQNWVNLQNFNVIGIPETTQTIT